MVQTRKQFEAFITSVVKYRKNFAQDKCLRHLMTEVIISSMIAGKEIISIGLSD